MLRIGVFIVTVLLSGWGCGYLLSAELRRTRGALSARALIYSLCAVLVPTVMAFALSSGQERAALLRQFYPTLCGPCLALAIAIPLALAIVGHLAGMLSTERRLAFLPSARRAGQALSFLPLALVWGLLEEIGWRGFLTIQVSRHLSLPSTFLVVGILWGLWHAPQMFTNEALKKSFRGKEVRGAGLWISQCVTLSVLLGWLQVRSHSFLYPALAHALVNAFEKLSCVAMGNEEDLDLQWAGNTGIPAVLFAALLALALLTL